MSPTDTANTGIIPDSDAADNADATDLAVTSHALKHAARELLARGNSLDWNHEGNGLTLHAGVGQRHAAGLPCMRLEHDQTRLLVALEHERGSPTSDDAHWQDHTGDARTLAWTLANENLLETLAQLFGNPLLPVGFMPEGGFQHLWLSFACKDFAGRILEGWLGIGEAEARRLMTQDGWQHDPAHLSLLGDASSLTLDLWLPGPVLSDEDLAATTSGDVLLLDTRHDLVARVRPTPETAENILGLPEAWAACHRDGQWLLAERSPLQPDNESGRLDFRLARFTMPLERLGALKPDTLLVRDQLLPGKAVDIMHANRHFAKGTLTTLGERLGVHIVHREDGNGFQ